MDVYWYLQLWEFRRLKTPFFCNFRFFRPNNIVQKGPLSWDRSKYNSQNSIFRGLSISLRCRTIFPILMVLVWYSAKYPNVANSIFSLLTTGYFFCTLARMDQKFLKFNKIFLMVFFGNRVANVSHFLEISLSYSP